MVEFAAPYALLIVWMAGLVIAAVQLPKRPAKAFCVGVACMLLLAATWLAPDWQRGLGTISLWLTAFGLALLILTAFPPWSQPATLYPAEGDIRRMVEERDESRTSFGGHQEPASDEDASRPNFPR